MFYPLRRLPSRNEVSGEGECGGGRVLNNLARRDLHVLSRSTDHGRGPQSYASLADLFAVYFPPKEKLRAISA
jgi:hypothetical protein